MSDAGARLDMYLARKLKGISRALIQRYIHAPSGTVVQVNGLARKPNYRLRPGDLVVVNLPEPKPSTLKPSAIPLEIIYEDGDIIAINKQPGIPVHPGAGHEQDTITNALLSHIGASGTLSAIGGEKRPGIVHRLDKDTAGVLLIAKNDFTHINLTQQFSGRDVEKIYEAIVKGVVSQPQGVIDRPIARSRRNRKKFAVIESGRKAITHYRVLDSQNDTSLVEFIPKTGRTHQIRVHALSIGHPVIGDTLYARKSIPTAYIALFARKITFTHPRTGNQISFTAPYPDHFKKLAERLGYRLEKEQVF